MPTRVHLADDHTMFREGLKSILSSREGLEVVGQSGTGEGAAARVAETRPDVVVAQLDTQPRTAEGIISGLRKASPGSRIVALTVFDNPRYLRAVSKMGIDAYLHKRSSVEELLAAIDAVSAPGSGNAFVSMPRNLLQRLGDGGPAGGLTERQTEILVLAARGLSNRLIGEELSLSEATVKRHLANVYEKVGVHSRNDAVRKALMEQWIGIHEITSTDGSDGQGG